MQQARAEFYLVAQDRRETHEVQLCLVGGSLITIVELLPVHVLVLPLNVIKFFLFHVVNTVVLRIGGHLEKQFSVTGHPILGHKLGK